MIGLGISFLAIVQNTYIMLLTTMKGGRGRGRGGVTVIP